MDPGEQTTGTRDEHYNLVSVLYHALHGAETCDIYALDAEASGRTDLYEFFRETQVAQMELAERAKELLGIGAGVAPGAAGGAPLEPVPPETDVPAEPPPEGDFAMEGPAEEVLTESERRTSTGAPMPEEDIAEPEEVPPDVPPPHIPAPPPPPDEETPPRSGP